jgi:C1A family cysteine protease
MKLLIQQGFQPNVSPKNRQKTGETVIAKSIDADRDEECGVALSKFNLNYIFEPKDHRDKKFSSIFKATETDTPLPAKVDITTDVPWGTMLDQGDLGSCVVNSVAYCIRFVRAKEKMTPYDPSRLFIYYFGRVVENATLTEDTGLFIRDGYKSVATYSVCSERNWPYVPTKFAQKPSDYAIQAAKQHKNFQYLSVDQDLQQLKKCLADGYPISFGITVFESFMSSDVAKTGKVPMPDIKKEQEYGGHAITLVGFDDSTKEFKVSNSWGDQWGDKGFFYLPYDYVMNTEWAGDFWTPRKFV